jgi:hypothetical protein
MTRMWLLCIRNAVRLKATFKDKGIEGREFVKLHL